MASPAIFWEESEVEERIEEAEKGEGKRGFYRGVGLDGLIQEKGQCL